MNEDKKEISRQILKVNKLEITAIIITIPP